MNHRACRAPALGFRGWRLGFRGWGLEFRVPSCGFRVRRLLFEQGLDVARELHHCLLREVVFQGEDARQQLALRRLRLFRVLRKPPLEPRHAREQRVVGSDERACLLVDRALLRREQLLNLL